MKVFVISGRGQHRYVDAGVDSAVLRPGEPLFLPDEPLWHSALVPVVRINRLGTSIKVANAPLYYNEISLWHMLLPESEQLYGIPGIMLDRAFSPGEWVSIAELDNTLTCQAVCKPLNGSADATFSNTDSLPLSDLEIDSAIEWLSKNITFKQGDVLIFKAFKLPLATPQINTSISASLNNKPVLNIRIK